MRIGFALILEPKYTDKIIQIENNIHKRAKFYSYLGKTENLPHITIFQGSFKNDIDYKTIANSIAEYYLNECLSEDVEFEDIIYKATGWFFLLVQKQIWIENLHYKTLQLCENYILPNESNKDRKEKLNKNEADAIKKYNYRYAGEAYLPHITIGRSSENDVKSLLEEIKELFHPLLGHKAAVSKITVYKMGKNGTHEKTLFEVPVNN